MVQNSYTGQPIISPRPKSGAGKDRPHGSQRRQARRSVRLIQLLTVVVLSAALVILLHTNVHPNLGLEDRNQSDNSDLPLLARPRVNIALAYAHECSIHRLSIFAHSWTIYSPNIKLVIFTTPDLLENPRVGELYAELGVEGLPFRVPPQDPDEPEKPGLIPSTALQHYLLYLETHHHGPGTGVAVLGSVENVALQGDPFTNPTVVDVLEAGKVLISEEGGPQLGTIPVETHAPTAKAVNECYGAPGMTSLGSQSLLVADVVFGPRDAALQYVRLLGDILETRVRFKCLRNDRPDVAALAHIVYEISKDPLNLDFKFEIAHWNDPSTPVLGVAFGLPAHMDGQGVVRQGELAEAQVRLRNRIMGGSVTGQNVEDGNDGLFSDSFDSNSGSEYGDQRMVEPAPAVLTQYSTHPVLLKTLLDRYKPINAELQFVQSSGYTGEETLPESWEKEAKIVAAKRGIDFNSVVDTVVKRIADATAEQEEDAEQQLGVYGSGHENVGDSEYLEGEEDLAASQKKNKRSTHGKMRITNSSL